MNSTTVCLPEPLPLHRPWPRRIWADLEAWWRGVRQPRRTAQADFASLAHLDAQTLRDIGAPDWVHAPDRAAALRQLERMRW